LGAEVEKFLSLIVLEVPMMLIRTKTLSDAEILCCRMQTTFFQLQKMAHAMILNEI